MDNHKTSDIIENKKIEDIGAKVYKVGGCVRDVLMGLEPKDIDYVVVGATVEQMLSLGYELVGVDFPVFLHPITKCEYALARTERKTGAGYNGFAVETINVTLEEDLMRRDLTINAMALDEQGNLIDPYNGQADLKAKVLRHVGVHFKEDPVRILRIARFSARYDFIIAPETISFMKEMVENGEFDNLTAERVWKEFEKVLPEKHLSHFFNILDDIGALIKIPGFESIEDKDFFGNIREVFSHDSKSQVFNLSLLHVFSQMDKNDLKKWKMPANEQQKIIQFGLWKTTDNFYTNMNFEDKITFIHQNKALHFPEQAANLLNYILVYQGWKNKIIIDNGKEINQLQSDIENLKILDYPIIVQEALINKIRPDIAVKSAQISLLQNNNRPKIKIK